MHPGVLWNVFLAVLPLFFALTLTEVVERYRKAGKSCPVALWLPLGLLWFAFLPNACYLLTEWRHFLFEAFPNTLRNFEGREALIVVGKQGLFFLLYSLTGSICFTLAIRPVERLVRKAGHNPLLWAIPFFFLSALGVYLGLFIRLNTWDILQRPQSVLQIAFQTLSDPQLFKAIIVFGVMLFLLYSVLDVFLDGLALRLHRRHLHLPFLAATRPVA